jgi:predicted dinucleotide-binding enzyme
MWRVGIIGSGNIGSAVALRLTGLGHHVMMANSRGPETLKEQARSLGIEPTTLSAAANAPDFVLIAIPEFAIAQLPKELFANTPPQTVILDAGNYYPGVRDGHIVEIDDGLPDSLWVSRQIGRPVLKMFNTIHANRIVESGRPLGAPDRICLPIAGDDSAAKAKAIALAEAIGFDGLDAGTLCESWRQQPGTPVYCQHLPLAQARAALAEARPEDVNTARAHAQDRARKLSVDTKGMIGKWDQN